MQWDSSLQAPSCDMPRPEHTHTCLRMLQCPMGVTLILTPNLTLALTLTHGDLVPAGI